MPAATVGAEARRRAEACTTEVRLGQAHAGPDGSIALGGRMHSDLGEYLTLHAQARDAIQRSAMLPGAELRAQVSRGENPHQ